MNKTMFSKNLRPVNFSVDLEVTHLGETIPIAYTLEHVGPGTMFAHVDDEGK
jgi:hypothetical protein